MKNWHVLLTNCETWQAIHCNSYLDIDMFYYDKSIMTNFMSKITKIGCKNILQAYWRRYVLFQNQILIKKGIDLFNMFW